MKLIRCLVAAAACALSALAAGGATASNEDDVAGVMRKWIDDFNKDDMRSFLAVCDPHASIVDGFPPYAWTSCSAWMSAYHANNKLIQATDNTLWVGKPSYSEVSGNHAYVVYPTRFSDR